MNCQRQIILTDSTIFGTKSLRFRCFYLFACLRLYTFYPFLFRKSSFCTQHNIRLIRYFSFSLARLQDEATPKSVSTPSRLRGIGNFLGNATPAHLRRLAGRMAARSPSLSIASSRRSKQSSSGSSNRSHSRSRSRKSRGSHRRQGTFPGSYSQRNSSEMDHQRPPADPVYTFMIKVTVSS